MPPSKRQVLKTYHSQASAIKWLGGCISVCFVLTFLFIGGLFLYYSYNCGQPSHLQEHSFQAVAGTFQSLSIDLDRGSIQIEESGTNAAELTEDKVRVLVKNRAVSSLVLSRMETKWSVNAGVASLQILKASSFSLFSCQASEVTVVIPSKLLHKTDLSFKTTTADVRIAEVANSYGKVSIQTESGDADVSGLIADSFSFNSLSGSLKTKDLSIVKLSVITNTGSWWASHFTLDGQIGRACLADARTQSGNIFVSRAVMAKYDRNCRLTFATDSGDITVYVEHFSGSFSLKAMQGYMSVVPKPIVEYEFKGAHSVIGKVTANGIDGSPIRIGNDELTLTTTYGNLYLDAR